MVEPMKLKSYGQACALAAALDVIGSRWTILILRDLMGGPARYVDLHRGLPGLASNLLADRLRDLEEFGLIEKTTEAYGVTLYRLTPLGEQTRPALAELGKLGLILRASDSAGLLGDPAPPKNLRFLAIAFQSLFASGWREDRPFQLGLKVDDEWFTIESGPDGLTVKYEKPPDGVPALGVSYDAVNDVIVPGADLDRFRREATVIAGGPEAIDTFVDLVGAAMAAY